MTTPTECNESYKSRADVLDLLIDQEHKLLAVYDARQTRADGKAAAALTAAVALGTVTLTAADLSGTNADVLHVSFAFVALTAAVSFAARILGGIAFHRGRKLTSESDMTKGARRLLRNYDIKGTDPNRVRELALDLWCSRATDSHKAAIRREKWAAGAGALLAIVLGCMTLLVISGDFGK